MQSFVLTIDLGTSGPKVALFDTQGRLLNYKFEEVPLLLYENGGAEQRPSDWINAIKKCYWDLVAETKIDTQKIIALNCTSQWSGTVAVDEKGLPLMDSIIWMDSRGAEYMKKLTGGLIEIDGYDPLKILKWLRLTGGGPSKSGKDPVAHILYIKNKLPEIYKNTYKFLEPKDYLNLYFTGIFASSFDAITLYWMTDNRDINHIKYHEGLVKMSGVARNKLPELVPTNSILGKITKEIAREFKMNENVQVISGSGDLHSAAVGSGAVKDYEAHLYVGTSSWLVCHLPFKKTDIIHNLGTIPSAVPGKYIIANEQQTSGACLGFLKNKIFFPDDALRKEKAPEDFYKIVDKMVEEVAPGSEGLIFLPWLYGERSPSDDILTRGGYYNLSLNNTRAHMLRALFEGVALNSKWLLTYVEKLAGRPFDAINFIGGGAHSAIWSQIIADIYDRPVRAMKEPLMSNSRGTALLALMALGILKLEDISKMVEVNHTYYPNPKNRKLYDTLFKRFLEIYKANKPLFAKLNKAKS